MRDRWIEERAARERGYSIVAGVDEAGRGPLAGPVVAGAVILPSGVDIVGVRDSKTLTAAQRDRAYDRIAEVAIAVGIGAAQVDEIDSLNILRASHVAMRRAVAALPVAPDVALIDGLPVPGFPIPHIAVVKGDARSVSIAAASIIAKVSRDRMMVDLDAQYPAYGFADHKGYPTPTHLALLAEHGPCPEHRRSFAPVQRAGDQGTLSLGMPAQHETGHSGETAVETHLRRLGWEVLTTSYRCRGGELDVVARDGDTIAFVEVKTRTGAGYGGPAEAVDARKRARLLVAAEAYLAETGLADAPCRFDVAEVRRARNGSCAISLLRGAFIAGE